MIKRYSQVHQASQVNVLWCTSVFLAIYYNKISLHSIGGVYSVYSLQSENERLLFRRYNIYIINYILYYKLIFSIPTLREQWTVDCRLWTLQVSNVIFKILKLSIIRYLVLSLTTCHIPSIHTERVDFQSRVLLSFDWKGGRWGYFSNIFCIFESTRRYFHSLQKIFKQA